MSIVDLSGSLYQGAWEEAGNANTHRATSELLLQIKGQGLGELEPVVEGDLPRTQVEDVRVHGVEEYALSEEDGLLMSCIEDPGKRIS